MKAMGLPSIRLDKFISENSELSRSLAGTAIRQGRVKVNGKTIKSTSLKVNATDDEVILNLQVLNNVGPRYFMLHKPAGFICANKDNDHAVVFELMETEINIHKLHTVGRLDVDTTGLVLITDDGNWSHNISSPKHHQDKQYRVWLAEPLNENAEQQLESGIHLKSEDKPCQPAKLERINSQEVLLTISEGKYHQVKRMFAALDNNVVKLHRESIGSVALDSQLDEGQYRPLTSAEILQLSISPPSHKDKK